ncbi:MAG: ATP-dependent metallopeptidase FtsH/Yme1/Tma family protein [Alphaproteobacteria bacterium]|nr:MAG: ATP-dependent metallopeptidase FtsH/Yme1/Tma family protein [Alphaproteobacteria bacterium]
MGRNILIYTIIALVLIALFNQFQSSGSRANVEVLKYSTFKAEVRKGNIEDAVIRATSISGNYRNSDGRFTVSKGPELDSDLSALMDAQGVEYEYDPEEASAFWSMLLSWLLPMLLLVGVWIFIMRQMQSGAGKAMGFGKSKARLLTESSKRVTFDDVAGVEEAKEEVEEIVEFLKDPQKFERLGGRIPRGALLVGPTGTGKTLLARAIAGEAKVPFFTISGSDFVEMFVGVGASRVRDMFEQAKKNAPCIVFIDEIDAVGRHRGAGVGGGNDEREQTLNQLLVEMDGFEENEGVIIIAATNRPDVLDPALLRPGRFDRQIVVPNPDVLGREKILKIHMRNVPLAADVKAMVIARGTPGFSGADLANLVNEAALLAARRGKKVVAMQEFEDAKDKVMMGPERRSMVMSEKEKELTAYHEAGHALMTFNVPDTDPIHKATIIPRGMALGMVLQLPESDKLSSSREQMHSRLAVMMGGRVAEEQIFGYDKVTSGASSDISQATKLARSMVTQWGMSDKMGPLAYGDNETEIFLGHSIAQTQNMSEETVKLIDSEIRRFVDDAYEFTRKVLREKSADLETIAQALIEYETLTGDELRALLDGEDIQRDQDPDDEPAVVRTPQTVPTTGKSKRPPISSSPEPQGT